MALLSFTQSRALTLWRNPKRCYRSAIQSRVGREVKIHRWLIFLLLARLALGLAYSIVIPAGEAPDEADHLAYAAYIAREGRLPVGAEMTQAKHPPLYHVLAAAVGGWIGLDMGFLRANPDVGFTPDASPNFFVHTALESWPWRAGPMAMRLARLISVFAGVGVVAATCALGRAIWPNRPDLAVAAAAFVAFLPESLFVGSAMNNDTLAALLGTTALWLALRSCKPWHALVTGIVMGLGLWAKVSVAALWPVVCLTMVVRGWAGDWGPGIESRKELLQWRVWRLPVIAGVVALLVTAPWFLRNRALYGDWMGWPLVLATIDRREGPFGLAGLIWLLRGLFVSFWGKFGGAGHIALPWPFYALWAALVVASAVGWALRVRRLALRVARCALRVSRLAFGVWRFAFHVPLILLGAPFLTFAWLVTYSRVALGTDQGRLLFPAIGPLALLLVGGLAGLWQTDGKWQTADGPVAFTARCARVQLGAWCGLLAGVAVLALIFGLWLPYAPPAVPSAAEMATGLPVGRVFGEQIALVRYRWEAEDTESRRLVLFWHAVRPVSADLRTSLRLLNAQGDVLWEWKRSPGAGRFSTDRWPVGRPVTDVYRVPTAVLARAARVEIGVRPFPEGPWLVLEDGAPALELAQP